jgi:hypothetical protein
MKKYVIILFIISTSCEKDYLDVVPDNIATIDLAFNTRSTAENFLSTCYTYIPEHANVEQNFSLLAGDDQHSTKSIKNTTNTQQEQNETLTKPLTQNKPKTTKTK